MIAPVVDAPSSVIKDDAHQFYLYLVLQVEKIVDIMHKISKKLSLTPTAVVDCPCARVNFLANTMVQLLHKNQDITADPTLCQQMKKITEHLEQSTNNFKNIVLLSESIYLSYLKEEKDQYLKKIYYPFKPPHEINSF